MNAPPSFPEVALHSKKMKEKADRRLPLALDPARMAAKKVLLGDMTYKQARDQSDLRAHN